MLPFAPFSVGTITSPMRDHSTGWCSAGGRFYSPQIDGPKLEKYSRWRHSILFFFLFFLSSKDLSFFVVTFFPFALVRFTLRQHTCTHSLSRREYRIHGIFEFTYKPSLFQPLSFSICSVKIEYTVYLIHSFLSLSHSFLCSFLSVAIRHCNERMLCQFQCSDL